MPFRKHARIEIANIGAVEQKGLYYTINYALTDVDDNDAYFHAQFRRVNPLPYKQAYTIVDGIRGHGHYVGTVMSWQQNSWGWWGEGEFKAYLDGDDEFPTICGTGTEDYFGGAWVFNSTFPAPFMGYPVGSPLQDKCQPETRHAMYRFHIMDPIRFATDFRATMQALGWRRGPWQFLPLQDDISSVAYWYQNEPHALFPKLPDRDYLEVI
ncbi:MAG: glycoside hydrolase family 172 protein [Lentisphaerota bacterium]